MQNYNGAVRRQSGNGRRLGYPTANIKCSAGAEEGVFIGFTTFELNGQKYHQKPSIIFVGTPVTLGDTDKRLETHVLDFPDIDFYGSEIEVEIIEKLRDNLKFPNETALISQMKADEVVARKKFDNLY